MIENRDFVQGTESAEIETPKESMGRIWGGSRGASISPSGVRGGARVENVFGSF